MRPEIGDKGYTGLQVVTQMLDIFMFIFSVLIDLELHIAFFGRGSHKISLFFNEGHKGHTESGFCIRGVGAFRVVALGVDMQG